MTRFPTLKRFGYHRMLSKRFPFALYYEVTEETTRVVAVLDMRRDPGGIQKVVQDRKITR